MRADPIGQALGEGRLGIGEVRGTENANENFSFADFTCRCIGDGDLFAGIVDEKLIACHMMLAHDWRQSPIELAEQIAEAAVAIAVGVHLAVLPPTAPSG